MAAEFRKTFAGAAPVVGGQADHRQATYMLLPKSDAPVYRGVQGTPVLFAADVFAELRALTGDAGARAVVKARPERVEAVAFDFAMPPDVDTPEDYAKLHVQ